MKFYTRRRIENPPIIFGKKFLNLERDLWKWQQRVQLWTIFFVVELLRPHFCQNIIWRPSSTISNIYWILKGELLLLHAVHKLWNVYRMKFCWKYFLHPADAAHSDETSFSEMECVGSWSLFTVKCFYNRELSRHPTERNILSCKETCYRRFLQHHYCWWVLFILYRTKILKAPWFNR